MDIKVIPTIKKALNSTYFKIILIIAIGFLIGQYSPRIIFKRHKISQDYPVEQIREGGYKLINPLLFCEIKSESANPENLSLKNEINNSIKEEIKQNKAYSVSVYFRNLNTGNWIGINEEDKYTPASLLKVPLMIAYFKLSESKPEILSKKVFYDGLTDANLMEHTKPTKSIQPNQSYTIEDLIEYMIKYSDNNATLLLNQNIDQRYLVEVYSDLGISLSTPENDLDFMSAKSYSRIFRSLYNATYLSRELSEKALEILSQSDFDKGISAEIPKNIVVAHKFGERGLNPQSQTYQGRELSECGIFYNSENPYFLCVMSKGQDLDILANILKNISQIVYNENNK